MSKIPVAVSGFFRWWWNCITRRVVSRERECTAREQEYYDVAGYHYNLYASQTVQIVWAQVIVLEYNCNCIIHYSSTVTNKKLCHSLNTIYRPNCTNCKIDCKNMLKLNFYTRITIIDKFCVASTTLCGSNSGLLQWIWPANWNCTSNWDLLTVCTAISATAATALTPLTLPFPPLSSPYLSLTVCH